jgi:hypothetical protein
VSVRSILNGLLEKGYKIVQEKQYRPFIDGREVFAHVLVQEKYAIPHNGNKCPFSLCVLCEIFVFSEVRFATEDTKKAQREKDNLYLFRKPEKLPILPKIVFFGKIEGIL